MKKRWAILLPVYLAFVMLLTVAVQGRSLQEWVAWLTPPGRVRELLMYPLQHHHPVTFAKLLDAAHFIGNIVLFLPVGMGAYLVFRRMFPASIRTILGAALFIGITLSTSIELFQYFVPRRIPSVADVIENTGGAVFGCYVLYFRQRWRELNTQPPHPCPSPESGEGRVKLLPLS